MRRYWAPLVVIGFTAAVTGLWGQAPLSPPAPAPYQTTILASQVDVYSGPGDAFYPTSRLRYGDQVFIISESKQPGWLVIAPPPGSFSWIESKYVTPVPGADRLGIVNAGDAKAKAPILPGSSLVNKEPNVEITQVATGTIVVLLDRPFTQGNISLYPIAPVGSDFRFIRTEALRSGGPSMSNNYGQSGYGSSGYGGNGQTMPTSWQSPAGPAPSKITYDEMARQADQLLKAGYADRARLLYAEALAQADNPQWRDYLTTKLNSLTPNNAGQTPPFGAQGYPTSNSASARPAGSNWNPTGQPVGGIPPTGTPPMGNPAQPSKTWSQYGTLRSTGFKTNDGQNIFLLEDLKTNTPFLYVTTRPGQTLRDYVGQILTLYGAVEPRNDANFNGYLLIAENLQTYTPATASR